MAARKAAEEAAQTVAQGSEIKNGYYSASAIAKLFGMTARRVQQLTQDGTLETVVPPKELGMGKARKYELVPTVQRYVKYLSDKAAGKEKTATEAKLKEQKLKAEIALKESQYELHKIRTDIAAGRYISVEEVKIDYSRFFISFKKFAMSVPSKVAGRLAGFMEPVEVRQIEKELQQEVTKLLKGFVISATVEEDEK